MNTAKINTLDSYCGHYFAKNNIHRKKFLEALGCNEKELKKLLDFKPYGESTAIWPTKQTSQIIETLKLENAKNFIENKFKQKIECMYRDLMAGKVNFEECLNSMKDSSIILEEMNKILDRFYQIYRTK